MVELPSTRPEVLRDIVVPETVMAVVTAVCSSLLMVVLLSPLMTVLSYLLRDVSLGTFELLSE